MFASYLSHRLSPNLALCPEGRVVVKKKRRKKMLVLFLILCLNLADLAPGLILGDR